MTIRNSVGIFLILAITLIKGAVWASEIILPKPDGPYSVATQAIELKDSKRTMLRDTTPRRWMVQAFYPSENHKGLYPYMPGTLINGLIQGVRVWAHAKPNSKILNEGPWSVIIFIPGLGEERQNYTILCEELASQGYIVLSLDQPYVTNFVRFLDGTRTVLACYDVWKVPRDRDYRYHYYDEAMVAAIEDIKYMLDHLKELGDTYFLGQINPGKVILMGHSFGGNVAHTLGFEDGRVKAVVDIDSKITERKIFDRIGVPPNLHNKPVFFIRGMLQYQEDVGDQLSKITNSTIWTPQVQHSAFRDMAYLVSFNNAIGRHGIFAQFWNWFWKIGPHFDAVDTGLGSYSIDDWFKDYREKIVLWLKGLPSFKD